MCLDIFRTDTVNGTNGVVDIGNVNPRIPVPVSKPVTRAQATTQVGQSNGSIIGDIFDTGKNIFDRIVNIELGLFEAEKIAELRSLEQAGNQARTEDLSGSVSSQPVLAGFSPQQMLIGAAIIGAGALLIARS